MDVKIEASWKDRLKTEFDKPYFAELVDFVKKEYQTHTVYPPAKLIFSAFDHCHFDKLKIVILGQDPYHGPGQANGLCFSVNDGVKFPPSLVNIFNEIIDDTGSDIPQAGNLERWADQGVMLLNATLTVRAHQAGSHQNKGWEQFTDAVVQVISDEKTGVVFLLWGSYAQQKGQIIDRKKHLVLECAHPSPFSVHRGFFGCKHFSKANNYLSSNGKTPVEW